MYKVIISQKVINQILHDLILEKSARLLKLRILCADRVVHLRGVIKEGNEKIFGMNTGDIYFDFQLHKEEVNYETVRLQITQPRFFSSRPGVDLIKLVSRFSNRLIQQIMIGLTRADSPFFILNRKKRIIGFDLKFILNQIPAEMDVLGKIKILNVSFEKLRIVWYVESNLILKSLLQFFKPNSIELEQIEGSHDEIRLLTDINLD